jgi:hypothetical protein
MTPPLTAGDTDDGLLTAPCHLSCYGNRGAFKPGVMVLGHALLGGALVRRFRQLNPNDPKDVKGYYKFIWDLFYLEYCLYPFL